MPILKPRSIYAAKLREFADFTFSDEAAFQQRGQWREFFRERIGPAFDGGIIFDAGCADAFYLAKIAAKYPTAAFVGLDWKCKALYQGAQRVAELGLANVALIRGRAQDVLKIFGKGELSEAWVFHPEPCDRAVELKNRLIAEPFMIDLHHTLRDGSSALCLKTDHAGYYQWVLSLLGVPEAEWFQTSGIVSPRVRAKDLMNKNDLPAPNKAIGKCFSVDVRSADYWHDTAALAHTSGKCFYEQPTGFESRFVKKRWPIYYVEMRKR
jgi:tRNA (guanine-N7-)-methyltransferase